jgi:hypothetical protein
VVTNPAIIFFLTLGVVSAAVNDPVRLDSGLLSGVSGNSPEVGKNSIKLYDKAYSDAGAVLRPEVTLNAPGQFRVFRHKTGQEEGPRQWRPLRAGIADLHRRAEVSQKALDRYCTALARVDDTANEWIVVRGQAGETATTGGFSSVSH